MQKLTWIVFLSGAGLASAQTVIAYGDTRFSDPQETKATNPKVRRWLVDRIAAEKPDAVLISGDLPWNGGVANDYAVYHHETEIWRSAHLLISPALGNHEFHGDEQQCLENWWHEFPDLRGRRWHAVTIGSRMVALNLDSMSSLLADSPQIAWIKGQINTLPAAVHFIFLNMHHPPVADVQAWPDDDHNPRPNEIAFVGFLKTVAAQHPNLHFIVCAGHIHNYERFYQDGVVYLVSGGGGAKPRPVVRQKNDLYQDPDFPNYHYVKFVLQDNSLDAEMIRVADPGAASPTWQVKDHFQVATAKVK